MNAEDARSSAKAANAEAVKKQFEFVAFEINKAVKAGKYEVWIYEGLRKEVVAKLEEQGFFVGKTRFERNDPSTLIKW